VKHKLEKGVQRCCREIEIAANIEAKEANAIELAYPCLCFLHLLEKKYHAYFHTVHKKGFDSPRSR
jgi:hypothetical protein